VARETDIRWRGRTTSAAAGNRPAAPATDLRGYIDLALQGGFPDMLALSERGRRRWIDSYVDQLLTRDAALVERGRDPARLQDATPCASATL